MADKIVVATGGPMRDVPLGRLPQQPLHHANCKVVIAP